MEGSRMPMTRTLCIASVLVVATLATTGRDVAVQALPHADAGQAWHSLGPFDTAEGLRIQSSIRTGRRPADPQVQGVVHRGGSLDVSPSTAVSETLRTGFIGAEPTLGVTSDGTILSSAVEIQSLPGLGETYLKGAAVRSTDDGASWHDATSSVAGTSTHQWTQDPYLYVDPDTDRVFHSDLVLPCQYLSTSDDAGTNWTDGVVACDETDHQNIFAGPPVSSTPDGYPNIVYNCAINGGALAGWSTMSTCDRSLDGGRTFLPTGEPAFVSDPGAGPGWNNVPGNCAGAVGHGFVGPDGTVYLPRGFCGQPWLAISRDEGRTWTRKQVSNLGMPRDEFGNPDHEAAVVADAGHIYYFWSANDRLPYLTVSSDGGSTWSTPVMVGSPDLVQTSLPAMAIGADGKLAFAYMGSTNAPPAPFNENRCLLQDDPYAWWAACPYWPMPNTVTWNGYITVTDNAADAEPTFHSVTVNDPSDPLVRGRCGPTRCAAEFDFIDVVVAPDGTAYAPFVDACVPGKACTYLGELVIGRMLGGPALR